MKLNLTAFVFWAFLAILSHILFGNWLIGLCIGLGITLLAEMFIK